MRHSSSCCLARNASSPSASSTSTPAAPKLLEPAALDVRVRVELAGDDARDPGLEHGVDAGRRRAVVRAGLHRHVERPAARGLARSVERDPLSVPAFRLRDSLPHDLALADDDRADRRLGMSHAERLSGELERPLHEHGVVLRHVPIVEPQEYDASVTGFT